MCTRCGGRHWLTSHLCKNSEPCDHCYPCPLCNLGGWKKAT